MTEEQMAEYLISVGWRQIWWGAFYRYSHFVHCAYDALTLKEAYRLQMKIERLENCGCS